MKQNNKIIMENKKTIVRDTLTQKFKKMYSSEVVPKLKQKKKLYSGINKLYSERNKLYYERNKLESEINKLYSGINKLGSKINKLDSEINKLDSDIFCLFYKFEKENDCKVICETYDFNLEDIKIKSNKEIEEEKKPEIPKERIIDGHKYKLIE